MQNLSLIAIVDEAGGIGNNNQLLCHLPADLQYFKSITLGKPIIMGRNTYESIGKPLPGRKNIVISKTLPTTDAITVATSINEAIESAQSAEEIMVIGGSTLYSQTIEFANRLYITRIHHHFTADVFFPHIDLEIWYCREQTFRQRDDQNPYDLTFQIYEHI